MECPREVLRGFLSGIDGWLVVMGPRLERGRAVIARGPCYGLRGRFHLEVVCPRVLTRAEIPVLEFGDVSLSKYSSNSLQLNLGDIDRDLLLESESLYIGVLCEAKLNLIPVTLRSK
jgi:hypothetical protein